MANIGHNSDGVESDPLRDRLSEEHAGLLGRTKALEDALTRVPTSLDDVSHDLAAAFVKQIRVHGKALDDARVVEKAPFLASGRTVDSFFSTEIVKMEKATVLVEDRIVAYLSAKADAERKVRAEQARLAREEADRLAAEVADPLAEAAVAVAVKAERAAAAPVAELARTRTSYGVTSGLRAEIVVKVSDPAKAVKALLPFIDSESLAKAARAWGRTNKLAAEAVLAGTAKPVPGLTITKEMSARVA